MHYVKRLTIATSRLSSAHALTSYLYLTSILKILPPHQDSQSSDIVSPRVALLQAYLRMILVVWISRGRPEFHISDQLMKDDVEIGQREGLQWPELLEIIRTHEDEVSGKISPLEEASSINIYQPFHPFCSMWSRLFVPCTTSTARMEIAAKASCKVTRTQQRISTAQLLCERHGSSCDNLGNSNRRRWTTCTVGTSRGSSVMCPRMHPKIGFDERVTTFLPA